MAVGLHGRATEGLEGDAEADVEGASDGKDEADENAGEMGVFVALVVVESTPMLVVVAPELVTASTAAAALAVCVPVWLALPVQLAPTLLPAHPAVDAEFLRMMLLVFAETFLVALEAFDTRLAADRDGCLNEPARALAPDSSTEAADPGSMLECEGGGEWRGSG